MRKARLGVMYRGPQQEAGEKFGLSQQLICALLGAALFSNLGWASEVRTDTTATAARELIRAGRYNEAADLVSEDRTAQGLALLIEASLEDGRYDEAQGALGLFATVEHEVTPRELFSVLILKARVATDLGELSQADAALTRAKELKLDALDPGLAADLISAQVQMASQTAGSHSDLTPLQASLRTALDLRQDAGDGVETAWARVELGGLTLWGSGDRSLIRKGLAELQPLLGEVHPLVGQAWLALGMIDIYNHEVSREQQESSCRQALEIFDVGLRPGHPLRAGALSCLGVAAYLSQDHTVVRDLFAEAVDIYSATTGTSSGATIGARWYLALAWQALGRFEESLREFETIAENQILLNGENHYHSGIALTNVGHLRQDLGDYYGALELYRRVERIHVALSGEPDVWLKEQLGTIFHRLGRYREADELLREAEDWRRGKPSLDQLRIAALRARLMRALGQNSQASEHLADALAMASEKLKPGNLALVGFQIEMVSLELSDESSGGLGARLDRLEEAIRESQEPGLDSLALIEELRGRIARKKGQLDVAIGSTQRAIDLVIEMVGENHPRLIPLYDQLCILLVEAELPELAAHTLGRAREIRATTLGPEHPDHTLSWVLEGRIERAQGRHDAALSAFLRASDIESRTRQTAFSVLAEGQKRAYQQTREAIVHLLLEAAMTADASPDRAYDAWVQWQGAVLESQRADLAGLEKGAPLREDLLSVRRQLAGTWSLVGGSMDHQAYQERIKRLIRQRDELETSIARERTGASPIPSARAVQDRLGQGACLIDYFRISAPGGQDLYGVFVLTEHSVALRRLGAADGIDNDIRQFVSELRSPGTSPLENRLSSELHDLLIGDLLPASTQELFISPDSALHLLPFEALSPAPRKVLLEAQSVTYLPAARDLLRTQAGGNESRALVLANPDLTGVPAIAATSWIALPSAEREGREVVKTLEEMGFEVDFLVGKSATEGALFRARAPAVLHLATHGFAGFTPDRKTPGWSLSFPEDLPWLDDPLVASGLALSADGTNDGLVTASEVMALPLTGVRLVVLSACDSGVGELSRAEGVVGLQRAFLLAGADALVLSLWPVGDEATRQLMVDLYRELASGNSLQNAMQAVRLARRRARRPPSEWAGFVAVGHGRGRLPTVDVEVKSK